MDHIKEEGEILVCERCPKHYYGQKELVKHMKQAHLDTKQYNCDDCSKILTGARAFQNHRRCHKRFKCTKCGKNLSINDKASHMRRCKGVRDKIKRCWLEGCYFTTEKLSSLKTHIVTHTKLICDVVGCGQSHYGKKNLAAHKRNLHKQIFTPKIRPKMDPKVHKCGACSYVTRFTTHLRVHEKSCKAKNRSYPPIVLVL